MFDTGCFENVSVFLFGKESVKKHSDLIGVHFLQLSGVDDFTMKQQTIEYIRKSVVVLEQFLGDDVFFKHVSPPSYLYSPENAEILTFF